MSYQVLARKWRPRTFHELVGQSHVQRALVNALDQGRLHHAYLFTGTRGVGKTTLARILAKCLNCTAGGRGDEGITSTPCGQCDSCRAIDEGRFVDLIEVDAASRTKVEDTRELLDNVQYAPTQGRYKVYLIDEVHMLSTSSFNALLKTLEEPPPHVKFLLATTDPQKLPATVLSRCLQFTLKHMPPERVVEHLTHVLTAEGISFDESALWLLGKAAEGSMRDAMSLTDQAIAFGQGAVTQGDVAAMLGTLDHRHILALIEALADVDVARLLAEVALLAEQGPDFAAVLDDMSGVLHRLAIAQMVPAAVDNGQGDRETILQLASRFTAEDIQLYYQIAVQGRGDMLHAPDLRSSLEMTLLRMLAFRPQGVPRPPRTPLPMRPEPPNNGATGDAAAPTAEPAPQTAPAAQAESAPPRPAPDSDMPSEAPPPPPVQTAPVEAPAVSVSEAPSQESAPVFDEAPPWALETPVPEQPPEAPPPALAQQPAFEQATSAVANEPQEGAGNPERESLVAPKAPVAEPEPAPAVHDDGALLDHSRWLAIFSSLGLGGLTRNLAANCQLQQDDGRVLTLRLDPAQAAMQADIHNQRIEKALAAQGVVRRLDFEVGTLDDGVETPHQQEARFDRERHAQAVELLSRDPHIQQLQEAFGAELITDSVKPGSQ